MIAQSGESTAAHSNTGNTINETSIFYKLPTTELLKHLLATENTTDDGYLHQDFSGTSPRQDDSFNKKQDVIVSQNVSFAVIQYDEGAYSPSNQYCTTSITEIGQDGSMERGISETENENTPTLQCYTNKSPFGSTTSIEDEHLLPRDAFNEQTVDNILAEAQRILSLGESSPASSQESDSCDLQQLITVVSKDVFGATTSKDVALCGSTENVIIDKCVVKENVIIGDCVEESMVFLPAGNIFHIQIDIWTCVSLIYF